MAQLKKSNHDWQHLREGAAEFGEAIGKMVSFVLLSVIYVVAVGLTSLIGKLVGKVFVEMNIVRTRTSYWEDVDISTDKYERYLRQY